MRARLLAVALCAGALAACDSSTLPSEPAVDAPNFARGAKSIPDEVVYNEYNRNYYLAVSAPGITWGDAQEAASGMAIGQCTSHLAAVTSQDENDWIVETFPEAAVGGYWIGGTQAPGSAPAEGWSWVTGEEWVYTNWSAAFGEPNDFGGLDEESLRFRPLAFGSGDGTWNDQNRDDVNAVGGYLVEYDCPTKVTGGAVSFGDDVRGNVGFNAHRGSDTSVKGQAEVHFFGGSRIHIEVTCLSVWGDDAWLGGVATRSDSEAYPAGTQWRWRVRDRGQGAAADQDAQGFYFFTTDPDFELARTCATHPTAGGNGTLFEITGGNFRIH